MRVFVCSIILATVVYSVDITRTIHDRVVFLPFLKNLPEPPPCPPNEVYYKCGGNCSDCTQRGMCTVTKCFEGCDCIPRFYRIMPDGPCESVDNCPIPECGENEIFRECGPICEKCTTFKCHVVNCDHKCYCREGYRRNEEGSCIPEEECPKRKRCTRREEWRESGPVDEFCSGGNKSTLNNETQEVAQCYCKAGHKRNSMGYCMVEDYCHIQCVGVEVYHDRVPRCNTTCRNYGNTNCTEDDNSFPGCFCPLGYVMNDFRACIPLEKCSLDPVHQMLDTKSAETTDIDNSTNPTVNSEDYVYTTVVSEVSADTSEVPAATSQISEVSADKSVVSTDTSVVYTQEPVVSTDTSVVYTQESVDFTDKSVISTEESVVSTEASVVSTETSVASTETSSVSTDTSLFSTDTLLVSTGKSVVSTDTSVVTEGSTATSSSDVTTEDNCDESLQESNTHSSIAGNGQISTTASYMTTSESAVTISNEKVLASHSSESESSNQQTVTIVDT